MRVLVLLFGLSCSDPPPEPPPPPTILHATVVDAVSEMPVAGARLMLLEQGTWHELQDGSIDLTLDAALYRYRVEAPDYRAEPRAFRADPDVLVIAAKTTNLEVRLQPLDLPTGTGAIAGKVLGPSGPAAGALVVATGTRIRSTYTDGQGDYFLGGLPADLYTVRAYLAGMVDMAGEDVTVAAERMDGIDLMMEAGGVAAGGRIRGGAGETTVYLVHPDVLEPIPGLEIDTNLSSAWNIDGVAPGMYTAQTALELDDGWVLDPQRALDEGPPMIAVATASASVDLYVAPSIKRLSPVESATVSATPVLSWRMVELVDFYVVEVKDQSGRTVFGGFDADGNPRIRVLPPDVSVTYAGDPLESGARYEWRVFAGKRDPLNPTLFEVVAASELLDGDFVVAE